MKIGRIPMVVRTRNFFFGFTFMLFAAFFMVVSIVGIIKGQVLANGIIGLCCLFVLTFSEGTEINKQDLLYRHYFSLFFIRIGDWQPLPAVSHFEVQKNESRSRLDSSKFKLVAKLVEGDEIIVGHYKLQERAEVQSAKLNRFWTSGNSDY